MAITKERLNEIKLQRQRTLQPLRSQQAIDLRYAHLDYKAGIPTRLGYRQRTPPTAVEWTDNGMNNYTLDTPRVVMRPRGDTPAARKADGKCESLANYLLRENVIPLKHSVRSTLEIGEGIVCVEYDDPWFGMLEYKGVSLLKRSGELTDSERKAVKEWQQQRLRHMPLRLRYVDPIACLPHPAKDLDFVPRDMMEFSEISVAEAKAWCLDNGFDWKPTKKDSTLVRFIKYVSPTELAYQIDDEIVWQGKNPLGFVNYLRVPSGYGRPHADGDQRKEYISITKFRRDMLKMEARAWSQADALVGRQAWERVKLIGQDSQVKRLYPNGEVSLSPDDVIREIPDQVTVEILHGEPVPVGLFEHLSRIESRAQVPMVLGGSRPTGVYSGEHQEVLIGIGKTVYKPPFLNWERALQVIVGMFFRIIEDVYQRPIQIGLMSPEGRNIDRVNLSDIAGHLDSTVEFLTDPPEASDFRKSTGAKLRGSGDISHFRELTEYHGMSVREAMIEMARVNAEAIIAGPEMQLFIRENAMRRLALRQQAQQAPAAEQQLDALGEILKSQGATEILPGAEGQAPAQPLSPLGEMGGIPLEGGNRNIAGGNASTKENQLRGVGLA